MFEPTMVEASEDDDDPTEDHMISIAESYPTKRSVQWDRHVALDILSAWERQKKLDAELQGKWLKLLAAGKSFDEAQSAFDELKKLRGEPINESHLLPGGIIAEPQSTPNVTPYPTVNDEDSIRIPRIRIKRGASIEEILQELTRNLEELHDHTRHPIQRIGVQSAIQLVKRGVYIRG
jgi:hypothetical protein